MAPSKQLRWVRIGSQSVMARLDPTTCLERGRHGTPGHHARRSASKSARLYHEGREGHWSARSRQVLALRAVLGQTLARSAPKSFFVCSGGLRVLRVTALLA